MEEGLKRGEQRWSRTSVSRSGNDEEGGLWKVGRGESDKNSEKMEW